LLALALEAFLSPPSPPARTGGSSSHRLGPPSETSCGRRLSPRCERQAEAAGEGSSHEVLRPFSDITQRVGILLGSTQAPSLFGLSQTLEGLILVELRGPVSYRGRSWGLLAPQGFSPQQNSTNLVGWRNPLGVFPLPKKRPRPQGIVSCSGPYLMDDVLQPPFGRCPPELQVSFVALRSFGLGRQRVACDTRSLRSR
jgi:hypothetical protein